MQPCPYMNAEYCLLIALVCALPVKSLSLTAKKSKICKCHSFIATRFHTQFSFSYTLEQKVRVLLARLEGDALVLLSS